ncbi:TetR/AcrR family transcriptional regulator [Marinomonas agarivorans]|nr:TetR/AcrR family transcriptional regulator [Marinomonas agarivorans]
MAPRYLSKETLESRENDILDQAQAIIHQEGFPMLTMDKLIGQVSYSKGTVYNHFTSKEDVFVALCNRDMKKKIAMFIKATSLDSCARFKMLSACMSYLISVLLSPNNFVLNACTNAESFDKASESRANEHVELNDTLRETCNSVIEEAVANNELTLPEGKSLDEISLTIYSMVFGSIGLFLKKETMACPQEGLILENILLSHVNIVMDGLQWKQTDADQQAFIKQLKQTVLADEVATLKRQGIDLDSATF